MVISTKQHETSSGGNQQKSAERRDTILVFNFGGQYCHLIARMVRENNVYSEIVGCDTTPETIREMQGRLNIRGIILSGGPESVYDDNASPFDKEILDLGIPILGLCYGHQLIAHLAHGTVGPGAKKEYGEATVYITSPTSILQGLNATEKVWMSHGDVVSSVPEGYAVLAHTTNTPVAAFRHNTKPIFGVQWHPEVVQTQNGAIIIKNFAVDVCECAQDWRMENLVDKSIREIRETVGDGKCLVTLSGGVDSSVAAALVGRAIGKNLIVVYVDTGLMREGETAQVKETFGKMGVDLRIIHAEDRFLDALAGVTDPEAKRMIIGETFIRVFEGSAKEIDAKILVQGTIYPDRVESGGIKGARTIKSHHNVGGLPKDMKFTKIVEPLRDLYKDEVRLLAAELGLPPAIVNRQPFPGPGLGIRIMVTITRETVEIERKADYIVTTEIENSGLAIMPWQYFAVLTDAKEVGVTGDGRHFGHVVQIRAVESRDGMTAKFSELPWELLRKMSTRITNEIPQVARVLFDITDKPPGTVEAQ
jgi:GMP synthase (glutamine-hydrolysing)